MAVKKQHRSKRLQSRCQLTANVEFPAEPETDVDETPEPVGNLETFIHNIKPLTRNEKLEGRDYLVVPMIMLTEGVHAGSNGPLYYPKTELSKTPAIWNHKPVVVYHPTMNGNAISACEPAVISRRKVGLIMNTKWEAGKGKQPGRLKAEAWLEVNRLKEVDKRVVDAINKKQMVEVSTGLFTDNEQKDGTWNGEKYTAIARNYRADHLAILPDEKGACSIEDGAGLLRNGEMSDGEKRDRLSQLIREKLPQVVSPTGTKRAPYSWVRDVFGSFCIYSNDDATGTGSRMFKQAYKAGKQGIELSGMPEEVTSRQTYMTTDGTVINTGDKAMQSKKALIAALIANANTHWDEDDRSTLNEMEPEVLEKMLPITNGPSGKNTSPNDTSSDGKGDDNSGTVKDGAGMVKPKKLGSKSGATDNKGKGKMKDDEAEGDDEGETCNTAEEYIANAPAGMRDVLAASLATHNAAKASLVRKLTANKACKFTAEQLDGKPLAELQMLSELAAAAAPPSRQVLNYGGQAGADPAPTDNVQQQVPLPVPAMVFNRRKAVEAE